MDLIYDSKNKMSLAKKTKMLCLHFCYADQTKFEILCLKKKVAECLECHEDFSVQSKNLWKHSRYPKAKKNLIRNEHCEKIKKSVKGAEELNSSCILNCAC